jgi:NitT/TauT family transport system substrate-binding protein
MRIRRRIFLQLGAGAVLASTIHACTQTSSTKSNSTNAKKILIGYWPIAGSLPLYLALEKGYFKEAGLDVEASKFGGAQQVVEGLLAGRVQASGCGTGSANLALGEILQPGLFKIVASNLCNAQNVLDEIILPKDSPIKTIADLKGKKIASGPGPQNETLAKGILEKNGVENAQVIPMEIKQHVAAISSGQVDAAYTLEPTGTIGQLKGITRTLDSGVIAKYILGNPNAAWFGGSAVLSTQFIKENPEITKKYIEVHRRAVKSIRDNPDEARKYLAGYTAIEGDLAKAVPVPAYKMYDEFTDSDMKDFQTFFDYMTEKKVFSKKVDAASLIYKDA